MGKGGYITQVPLTVPGLVTWLDADDPSGNGTQPANSSAIATWVDKSGNGYSPTQATGANQPLFTLNRLGGKPGVVFDGVNDSLAKTSYYNLKQMTIFVVGNINTQSDTFYEVSNGTINTGTSCFYLITDLFSRYTQGTSTLKDVVKTNGLPFGPSIVTNYYDGSNLYSYVNAQLTGSVASTVNTNTLNKLNVGCLASNNFFMDGFINELLIYSIPLSGTEITKVTRYLANKWGISIS
jgi:hypothetical protein